MKDLNRIERDNLEWEKRLQEGRKRREAELAKWKHDPDEVQRAYEKLFERTSTMMQEALRRDPKDGLPSKAATLEDLLSAEDYAFLAGLKITLGGPDGAN